MHSDLGEYAKEGKERQKEEDVEFREEEENSRRGKFYLKSNMPAWLLLIGNVAAEIDLAPHFSFELAGYYSGLDWFRSDIKFKTVSVSPAVRYWLRQDNRGVFFDIHGGCVWYNFAFGGKSRWQDHDGKRPALGGGIGIGYRLPLGDGPWSFEFAAGAGAYRLDYDVFYNKPDGLLKDRVKKWFFGIDRVAVSIVYAFGFKNSHAGDLNRKGGAL